MNSLGTSRADNLKYDELKELRENLYKECVPILKDLISINNNIEAIRTLMKLQVQLVIHFQKLAIIS